MTNDLDDRKDFPAGQPHAQKNKLNRNNPIWSKKLRNNVQWRQLIIIIQVVLHSRPKESNYSGERRFSVFLFSIFYIYIYM